MDNKTRNAVEAGHGVGRMTELEKTIAERVRAAQQDYSKAGRVGERLRGMAENVWSYATAGERGAEQAYLGLEQTGAEFERNAA